MAYTPIPKGTLDWDVPVNTAFTDQDARITINEGAIGALTPRVAALETAQGASPVDQGFASWTYDPSTMAGGSGTAFGTVYTGKIILRAPATITNVSLYVNSLATTLTAAQNFAGLYDVIGNRLGVTADQSANWTTTGLKTMPFAGGALSLSAGVYYASFVSNGTGTLGIGRSNNAAASGDGANFNLAAASYRWALGPALQTSLPATITMSSRTSSPLIFWYGIN